MATPVGHSIVGYALGRAAGLTSKRGLALAMGAACLPDVDMLLGYVANGDAYSLHREVITHKRAFPLLVGAAVGLATAAAALRRGRLPRLRDVLRPAVLATALVSSHIAMDRLPLPYEGISSRPGRLSAVAAAHGWNAVIDMAVYGTLAVLAFERNGAASDA